MTTASAQLIGRGAGVDEQAALEMQCRGDSTVGSNPTLSARQIRTGAIPGRICILVRRLTYPGYLDFRSLAEYNFQRIVNSQ